MSSTVLISTLLILIPQISVWGIQDALGIGVELLSLRQHLVEVILSQHGAQGGLGQHIGGGQVGLNLNDGPFGIDDIEMEHGVDLH